MREKEASLFIDNLRPEQVRVAYPLVRAADPSITLADWLRHAGPLASRPSRTRGILVARRTTGGYPVGVVCYRIGRPIARGTELTAEHLVALDLLHPERVAAALVAALDRLARSLGCRRLRHVIRNGDTLLFNTLYETGLKPESISLVRTIVREAGKGA